VRAQEDRAENPVKKIKPMAFRLEKRTWFTILALECSVPSQRSGKV